MKRGADAPELETVETAATDRPEGRTVAGKHGGGGSGDNGGDKVETEWRQALSIPSSGPRRLHTVPEPSPGIHCSELPRERSSPARRSPRPARTALSLRPMGKPQCAVAVRLRIPDDQRVHLPEHQAAPHELPPGAPIPRQGEVVYLSSTSAWGVALIVHDWRSPKHLEVEVWIEHLGGAHTPPAATLAQ